MHRILGIDPKRNDELSNAPPMMAPPTVIPAPCDVMAFAKKESLACSYERHAQTWELCDDWRHEPVFQGCFA